MNLDCEPGNDKQNNVVWISVSLDNGKMTRKEMPFFFLKLSLRYDDMVKCRRNVNFEEMDTEHSTGKNDKFWLLWGIFQENIKENIIVEVLRKENYHSFVICRLIKKSAM